MIKIEYFHMVSDEVTRAPRMLVDPHEDWMRVSHLTLDLKLA